MRTSVSIFKKKSNYIRELIKVVRNYHRYLLVSIILFGCLLSDMMKNFCCDRFFVLKFSTHPSLFLFSKLLKFALVVVLLQCHGHSNHFWRVTIQHKHHSVHIAEVHFFQKGQQLSRAIFIFTASSYMNAIPLGGSVSGPPEAANDGDIKTFFHSAYDDQAGGYRGTCCPDPTPTLIVTTQQNITFDRITIINRQDLDQADNNFFDRLIGATVTVHDRDNTVVLRSKVTSASSSYNFDMPKDKSSCLPGKGSAVHTSIYW